MVISVTGENRHGRFADVVGEHIPPQLQARFNALRSSFASTAYNFARSATPESALATARNNAIAEFKSLFTQARDSGLKGAKELFEQPEQAARELVDAIEINENSRAEGFGTSWTDEAGPSSSSPCRGLF